MLDRLLTDLRVATMDPARAAPYGALENAAIGVAGGKIRYVGPVKDAPAAKETIPPAGLWVKVCVRSCVVPFRSLTRLVSREVI